MNIKIISDVTHLIFNEEKMKYVVGYSEYIIGSLRKSFPIPDGSFVVSKKNVSPNSRIRDDFVYKRTYGLISRYFSLLDDFKNAENLGILESSEKSLDSSVSFGYNISFVSENLIKNIPISEYMKKTKINFMYLEQELGVKYNFYSQYFPILFKEKNERDGIGKIPFENMIFPPIHWDTLFLKENYNKLSEKILSVPCDYRYNIEDMKRVVDLINGVTKI